jgi:hypothetical protein
MKKIALALGSGLLVGALGLGIAACNTLPAFSPVFACLAGELANGAIEDPILLLQGCAGATIAALIQVIEEEIANLAGLDAGASSDGTTVLSTMPNAAQAYQAHLQRVLTQAKALQASGHP